MFLSRLKNVTFPLVALLSLLAVQSRADDRARTAQLPPALSALGVANEKVVSRKEADLVRGASLAIKEGVIVQFSGSGQVDGGALAVAGIGGGQQFTFTATTSGVSFQATGIAVDDGAPQKQGILVTQTGSFNGGVAFQGDFTGLSIIALPGAFQIDFR